MNNNMLFKFAPPTCTDMTGNAGGVTQAIGSAVDSQRISNSAADMAVPIGKIGDINIAKNFRWTKSAHDSEAVKNVPVVTLRELLVTVPAFFSNLQILFDQLVGPGNSKDGILQATEQVVNELVGPVPQGETSIFKTFTKQATEGFTYLKDGFQDIKKGITGQDSFNFPMYLKSYENVYGVKATNFLYRLPYLEDNYKTINNGWSKDTGFFNDLVTSGVEAMAGLTKAFAPGVGVDFAKSFEYPDTGPSYKINFYLDNTTMDGTTDLAKNFRFIYLLIYQNLANRINRTAITPPVIYQASLPGVFSYRWSMLSDIAVNFVGVRRPFNIKIGGSKTDSEVIIPEGYEVQLTLTSLTPETKNLMFDSINKPVKSYIQESDSETSAEEQAPKPHGKFSYKHDDPTATKNPRSRKVPTRRSQRTGPTP